MGEHTSAGKAVVTRFAPSPTGFLHLGGVRTALFNWLFAQNQGGQFLLRVEDTDQARNSQESLDSILKGLDWLGLTSDAAPVFQSANKARHQQVAKQLFDAGHAYWCNTPSDKVQALKDAARTAGKAPRYPSRDAGVPPPAKGTPAADAPVLRFKMPQDGTIDFEDQVQGNISVRCDQLDDLVLLRSDGSPTYMLGVVVDDHDMGITHVVRGADHLSNTPKQICLYRALGWTPPTFAHLPLIHGADGAKLSKRHGALDVREYQEAGFLPDALFNALLRLGWGHGDQEIFSRAEAAQLFSLKSVSKSPARFDPDKLKALNAHYLRQLPSGEGILRLNEFVKSKTGNALESPVQKRIAMGWEGLVLRADTFDDLSAAAQIYQDQRPPLDDKAAKILDADAKSLLARFVKDLFPEGGDGAPACQFTEAALEDFTRGWATTQEVKMKQIAQALRAALTGKTVSPPIFQVMVALGLDLVAGRLG